MTLALDIDRLACVRARRTVFEGLCLAVAGGALVTVEGPNGSGKTSLLRILAGFLAPAAGIVRIRTGEDVACDGEDRARLVGWLGHLDAVKPQLTVAAQLAFWARLYGATADLDAFGLSALADIPGQFLSAGQKRRLALARLALMGRPLWLLDEPLASLDAAGKALVADAVRTHCAGGGIAVVATHEPLGLAGVSLRLGAA